MLYDTLRLCPLSSICTVLGIVYASAHDFFGTNFQIFFFRIIYLEAVQTNSNQTHTIPLIKLTHSLPRNSEPNPAARDMDSHEPLHCGGSERSIPFAETTW